MVGEDPSSYSRNWKPNTTGAGEVIMISPDPRPSPGLARWAESYEAKCERRQETRESRRCRPNVTTCRQLGKALRTQHREQLQRARQQQFFRRRNLEVEEKGQAWHLQAREQGPSRRPGRGTGQTNALKELLFCVNKISASGQQVTGASPQVLPIQHHPSTSLQGDLATHHSSQTGAFLQQASPTKKPHKHHRGTQTKAEKAPSTIKNDASQQTNYGVAVLDKEIIQLSEYLKEALQRELVLKQKMVVLQDLLSTLIQASDSSWKGQLNEDKLKGKLRSLENQLYTCTQGTKMKGIRRGRLLKYSPWGMKKVLLEMEDQKNSYEQKAKESLQKVLEEKMSVEQQLESTQRSLALAEQNCEEWRGQYEALKEAWKTLGIQHSELENQFHILQSKLQGADSRDAQLNQTLRLLEIEHQELQAKIECLQGDRDLCNYNTQDLQDQLKRSEEEKHALMTKVQQLQCLLQNQSLHPQEQEKLVKKDQALPEWNSKPSHNEVKPEGTGKEKDCDLRDQLQKKNLQLQAQEKECRELHSELDNLSDEYISCLRKLQHCREELNHSQQPPPRRQCDRWLPVLIMVIATVLAVFLANKNNLII
ncbi:PREDICTED: TRAF3-interacting JNK-activating modulator isoform X3 [Dipodomys ordii]|uniref:TRAF3-interacting JNK-activating modulator isoform X3 n=1 Tax=Dipodomys ordii TaxID=10020 RepID=A0A1S3F3G7_DIPOR|nr:PREDICTED: TRAF3-interacting JNK-activating modulator isoform X3 [Dipodomys ordii]